MAQHESDEPVAIYRRLPVAERSGIPIFIDSDDYVENYRAIADMHVRSITVARSNPFVEEHIVRRLDDSTAALIARHARDGARILDIGVGPGRVLERFSGLRRHGVDLSLDYLELAAKKGIDVCCANAEELPYRDGLFDVVVSTDVLEHVLDLNRAVAEIDRVLRPRGIAIVRVPYRENLAPYLAPEYPFRYAHLRSFDEHALRLLFTRVHAFEHVEESYVYALSGGTLRLPRFHGRGALAAALDLATRPVSALNAATARLACAPLEINAVLCKRHA